MAEAAHQFGVVGLPYGALGGGVLTGKYEGLAEAPAGSRLRLFDNYFERYAQTCAPECVECYKKLAFNHGISPAALATCVAALPTVIAGH